MKRFLSFCYILGICFVASVSNAQVGLEGISSGRYEVRKAKLRTPASEQPPVVTDSEGIKIRTLKASELVAEEKARKEEEQKKLEVPNVDIGRTSSPVVDAKPTEEQKEFQEPTIGEQAESLFSRKTDKIYDFYREQINEDDIRHNRAELDILPIVAYNDSQSNYSFRDYQSYFNGLQFKANVWFTPLIGVTGKIMFSLAADVDSMAADKSRIPAKYEMVDLGINFRRFFGVTPKSNSLEFSLIFSENKMITPSNNVDRVRLKSQGFGVGLKTRMPSSSNYAWVFGGSFFPRLQHTESETGINLESGASGENIRIGLDLGGEWKFTRESQMVWNLGMSAERNIFTGVSNIPDPSTGLTPSNVGVTNSMYIFSLGYRWGH